MNSLRIGKTLLFIICVIICISCIQENSKDKKINPFKKNDIIKENDTIYKGGNIMIIKNKNLIDTLLRFNSNIKDSLYFVKSLTIRLNKKLDFSNYEYKKMFITRTQEEVSSKGVNFAGHFCFVYWGCGSPCQMSAVVDMKTGKVYNGINASNGYEYRKDSRLLIVNPPDSANWYNKNIFWQQPSQYIWTGKKFIPFKVS
jgi:hypothetical protein